LNNHGSSSPSPKSQRETLERIPYRRLNDFLAVMMGFFAENIREYLAEQHKKKELLEIVSQDFAKDLEQLKYHENFAKEKLIYVINY